jgi:hypothetical protein
MEINELKIKIKLIKSLLVSNLLVSSTFYQSEVLNYKLNFNKIK